MNEIFNSISDAIISTSDFVAFRNFCCSLAAVCFCLCIRVRCRFAVSLGHFANCEKSRLPMAVNRKVKSARFKR